MKEVAIVLSGKALEMYNEILYSLESTTGKGGHANITEDAQGCCTPDEAIEHALLELALFEEIAGESVTAWAATKYPEEFKAFQKGL
jgi:hypothetical protein